MRVVSLFDGISCARVALEKAGLTVDDYFASEVERNAIKVSLKNYPDIVQCGDVKELRGDCFGNVDLLIGGSPCQDLSIAKKGRKGLEGDRSSLFWEYVRIWKETKPAWFVLENVASMPKADRDIITKEMGVEPVMINASLVSAQCRKRLFWTNIPVTQPEDRGILLKDILQLDAEVDERMVTQGKKAFCLDANYHKVCANQRQQEKTILRRERTLVKCGRDIGRRLTEVGTRADYNKSIPIQRRIETRTDDKCGALTSVQKDVVSEHHIRKLTPIECERLQGLPDGYTEGVAMTNRYRCLGNAFNTDVVAHILASLSNIGPV